MSKFFTALTNNVFWKSIFILITIFFSYINRKIFIQNTNLGCLVDFEELWLKVNLSEPHWREMFLDVYMEVKFSKNIQTNFLQEIELLY